MKEARMKQMRISSLMVLATALCIGALLPAMAQAPRAQRRERAAIRVPVATVPLETLDTTLKLTADQKSKIKSIQDKFEADAKPLRPEPGAPRDPANMQKLRDLTNQANRDIEAVLTPDQMAKLREVAAVWSALRSAGIPLDLLPQLKLTADQNEKIAAIVKEMSEKLRGLSPDERRSQAKELRQDARNKIEVLLTEQQKETLRKYQAEHRTRGRRRGSV
jgi:Spy/CpxP family protein refolding chaperone